MTYRRFNFSSFPLILTAAALSACASLAGSPPSDTSNAMEANFPAIVPFNSMSGTVNLSGDVHRVPGSNPQNIIIMVGGSGAHLRNDVEAALPLFLTKDTAVAIFDRRGSGHSTGTLERPGTSNSIWQLPILADDVKVISTTLSDMGFDRIGIIGSSMGAWIAVAAAANNETIDFVIAINGGASSVALSDAFDTLTDQGASIEDSIEQVGKIETQPSYSPQVDLSHIDKPVMWILGEMDDSNPTELDLRTINYWKQQGKVFSALVVEGADHNFVNVKTGETNLTWLETAHTFIKTGK